MKLSKLPAFIYVFNLPKFAYFTLSSVASLNINSSASTKVTPEPSPAAPIILSVPM